MEIILIHGNDPVSIENRTASFKKNFDNLSIIEINAKGLSSKELIDKLSTPQMFFQKSLFILENVDQNFELESLPKSSDITLIFKFLSLIPQKSPILKSATRLKTQIILLTKKEEVNIFQFLDSLAQKDSKALFLLPKLETLGYQYLLTMIFYLLRRLIISPKNVPDFVKKKTQSQQKNFSLLKINNLYAFTLQTDFRIKSGLLDEKTGLLLILDKIIRI